MVKTTDSNSGSSVAMTDESNFLKSIDAFQKEEITYAKEVAEKLKAKLFISEGAETIDQAVSFISSL